MSLQELISISRRYGADPDFVVAGGGNTSWKTGTELYVKASGSALSTIDESGFVKMDRAKLAAIWTKTYPADSAGRESAVLADMMAARAAGEEAKRPSVETLLHDVLPYAFVVHTHPALVNGLTCAKGGEAAAARLFGDDALWIPSTNPGYVLSRVVKDAYDAHSARTGKAPSFILLQNHGVFVAADTPAGIDAIYVKLVDTIKKLIARFPDFSAAAEEFGPSAQVASDIRAAAAESGASGGAAAKASIFFLRNAELARLTADSASFRPVASAYSPDHIVYAGSDPLWVDAGPDPHPAVAGQVAKTAWAAFAAAKKRAPKLVAVRALGVFGVGSNEKSARLAVELFLDAAKVAAYVESFGGPLFMSADQIDFINTWEVEQYRSKVSTGAKH